MDKLERFRKAQDEMYGVALDEIKKGGKVNHWMWYVFPQIDGLGLSEMSEYYAIHDLEEAREYLNDKKLGFRLYEITEELLKKKNKDAVEIFGEIDSLKLHSCMTLFDLVSPNDVFYDVICDYYHGEKDQKTLDICSANYNK